MAFWLSSKVIFASGVVGKLAGSGSERERHHQDVADVESTRGSNCRTIGCPIGRLLSTSPKGTSVPAVLLRTIHTVLTLCASRRDGIGKKGPSGNFSTEELGDLVDVSRRRHASSSSPFWLLRIYIRGRDSLGLCSLGEHRFASKSFGV